MAETQGFKARVEYEVTDGTQLLYTFPFSYLRKKFIKVDVLHADNSITSLTYGVDYVVNALSLTLTNPVKVGEHLIIYRQTTTDKIITWNDGSILLASDMNTADVQMLHLQEEQQDYIQAHSINTKTDSATKEVLWDALNHRVVNVSDPIDPQDVVTKHYMESVQDGFVVRNTSLLEQATTQAANAKNSASSSATSASQSASSASASETSNQSSKKWAESTSSPDWETDTDSTTGLTQSSRSWALYSKSKAQEVNTSATNAKASEINAKASETHAKTSETKAATSEANAKTSETNAKTSETRANASASASASSASASATSASNAKTSATNAANSARQAAESAGVFRDFQGATASTDGIGGRVPKPLAGQQNKVLKADGTWGDGVTPNTLWNGMHHYPVNYAPSDTSNVGWNRLGFCSICYDANTINNQPTEYGQLINIPEDTDSESMQLWVEQPTGVIFSRGGDIQYRVNDSVFRMCEQVDSKGDNWIRYASGLQICWENYIPSNSRWNFPVAFSSTPVVQLIALDGDWAWVGDITTTGCQHHNSSSGNGFAIGWWK